MDLSDLNLGDLRAFFLVAETGSFARAAKRLEQSKPVVSRRVARLEELLSVHLLQRTTTGTHLTEAGHTFYDEAQTAMSQLERAAEVVTENVSEIAGHVRVTVPMYFGAMHLSEPFSVFMAQHPKVELEVHLSDDKVDLMRTGFDLAVRTGHLPDSTLVHRIMASYRRLLVASPDYLRQHPPIRVPEDLQHHKILHYNSLNPQELWRYHVGETTHQFTVTPYLRSNGGTMLMTAATAGLGLTVLPTYLTIPYIEAGKVVQVLPDIDWGVTPVNILMPAGRKVTRRVRTLVEYLVTAFEGQRA